MTPDDMFLDRLGMRHARQLADALAAQLASRGVDSDVRERGAGFDVLVKNHGLALEYGTFEHASQPVVRTVIEQVRTGATI